MFETKEKKQLFANWLWKVANADGNLAKEEIQILNNIGMSLGLQEIKYQELGSVEIDNVEKTFLFSQIKAIEKHNKRPMVDNAFIDIDLGGHAVRRGSLAENAIMFNNNADMDEAYQIMSEAFNTYLAKKKENETKVSSSAADELLKYKQLLDMGVISEDEFNAKKKALLNL